MKPPYKTLGRLSSISLLALATVPMARALDYQTTVVSQGPVGYYRLNETVQPPSNIGLYATNAGSLAATADGAYVSSPVTGLPGPFSGSVAVGLNGTSQ